MLEIRMHENKCQIARTCQSTKRLVYKSKQQEYMQKNTKKVSKHTARNQAIRKVRKLASKLNEHTQARKQESKQSRSKN